MIFRVHTSGAFQVLLNIINAAIDELNKMNYSIYDTENPEWRISKVDYNRNEDKLYFACEEVKEE